MDQARQHGPDRTPGDRWWIVAGMGLAVFMASLDMSVVNLALPAIRDTFGAETATTQWVVLGYLLPLVGLALPTGRWLNGTDHRTVLIAACIGFAVCSVAAGLAPAIGWLIAARILQGLCGSALMTLIPVLTSTAVDARFRGRAMGLVDTLGMLGLISGPAIGGLIVDSVGWPWIFHLNVPVCAALVALAFVQLPRGRGIRSPVPDTAGEAVLLTAAAGALMIALTLAAGQAPQWLALGLLAVPLILAWYRLPASGPVRELLGMPPMHGPLGALTATAVGTGLVFYIVPFHLITVLHISAPAAGLTMLAFPLAAAALSPAAGFLADRYGDRRIAFAGMTTLSFGLLLLMPTSQSWVAWDVAWRLAVAGAGIGLFNAPNMSAAMSASPVGLLATAGAATSLARQAGFACGPAMATLVWGLASFRPGGIRGVFAAALVVVAVGAVPLARSLWPAQFRDFRLARLNELWLPRLRDFLPDRPAAPKPAAAESLGPPRTLTTTQDLHALHGPAWIGVQMTQKLRGREGEERQIMRMLHTVAADTSAVLHLEGGWGSGRTRLLRQAADAASRLGFTVVDRDWTPGSEPAVLFDTSGSRRPVLVALDDLQHADPVFVRSLRALPWRLRDRPIAWLLSRRRGAGGPSVDQLFACAPPSGGRMDLRPLSPQAIGQLVADCSYGSATGLAGFIRATGGNPLLAVELARGIHGDGNDGIVGRPPIRVQACVRRCMAELDAGCRQLLRVASVLGVRFALSDVATMLEQPAAELLAPLDEALAADILRCDGDRLVFAQELFWRCVLVALPDSARAALLHDAAAKQISTATAELATTMLDRGRRMRDVPRVEARPRAPSIRGAGPLPPAPGPRQAPGWKTLSDIEREIAQLVSQGLTNQQIASQVFRSPHTINYYLRQIFRKLDIHSRVELARLTLLHYSADGDVIYAAG